jgi:CRP-like cAMP-binding protein
MARPDATTMQRKMEMLASLPLFHTYTKEELSLLAELTVEASLPAGSILTYENQVGGLLYVLLEGQAEVTAHGTHIATVGPGDVVGEMALIDQRPRTAEVVATTDVRVIEVGREDFKMLMDRAPDFAASLQQAVATRRAERLGGPPADKA